MQKVENGENKNVVCMLWQERRAANSLKASNMTPSRSGGGTCGMKGRKVGQTSEKVDE
jgi:hypothetical protein